MPGLWREFRDHPESVGETYGRHWCSAMGFALAMLGTAAACMIHAFVPGLFKHTASSTLQKLHARMVTNRQRHVAPTGTQDA